jgi:isopentenyl diphosphate isomerase/L-lactate dehydrogenase-like FMN-dependent dehydrogenase
MRAFALGICYCLIDRAYGYGLGAGAQSGVATAVNLIRRKSSTSQ